MRLIVLFLTLLSACVVACSVDAASPAATAVPADDLAGCGPYPSRGHYSVTYGADLAGAPTATLPRADFEALIAERVAAKEWAICAGAVIP